MEDLKIIKAKLRLLLPTVDLETATQRSIQQQLEDELGIPLDSSEYKSLIKTEADSFLLGVLPDEDKDEAKPPVAKRPRQESKWAQPTVPTAAAPPPAPVPGEGPEGFIYCAPISTKRYIGVRLYKNKPLVDVREFYNDGNTGKLLPGSKGLSMNFENWTALVNALEPINEAFGNNNDSFFVDLGNQKRMSVSSFGGKMMISLREYYDDNGQLKPGKKGISLPPDQWAKLCGVYEEISRVLEAQGGGAGPSHPATAAHKSNEDTAAAPKPSSAATSTGGTANAIVSIELSSMRRAEVVNWKGRTALDIREFYLKNDALAHSKKGLQMDAVQWNVLKDNVAAITAALQEQNANYSLQLSDRRKATISSFKGKWFVDLREYYVKEGALAPTQKGISLKPEEWDKVVQAIPALDQALQGN